MSRSGRWRLLQVVFINGTKLSFMSAVLDVYKLRGVTHSDIVQWKVKRAESERILNNTPHHAADDQIQEKRLNT